MSTIRKTTEDREAMAYTKWCMLTPVLRDLVLHIANERACSAQQGYKLKMMGVRRGVSDYFVPLPRGKYHGLWIELKKDKTCKPTFEQEVWLARMRVNDYAAFVAHGADQAIKLTKAYIEGRL